MFVTADDLREFLGGEEDASDLALSAAVEAAWNNAEAFTGRHFEEAERREKHHGQGDTLFLYSAPIAEIASIVENKNGEAITEYEFETRDRDNRVFFEKDLPAGKRNITVQYTAGWTEDTFPADLKMGILLLAAELYRAGAKTVRSESVGEMSVGYQDQTKTNKEKAYAILESYRFARIV